MSLQRQRMFARGLAEVTVTDETRRELGKALADISVSMDKKRAIARQELRRSNAAVPIPSGRHKRTRSAEKQALRQSWR